MSPFPEIQTLEGKLQLERDKMLDACKTLSTQELLQAEPGDWSVKDILAHVANAELINVKFARLMLEQDTPKQLEAVAADYPDYTGTFELDRFNAYMADKLRAEPLAGVMQTLNQARLATYEWLETLTPEQLERTGQHAAWGEQTVRGMIKILILHDKMHTQQIVKRAGSMK
jgi:uncharacterized damage-inducible protein DinB